MTVRVLLVEDDVDHALLVSRGLPASAGFEIEHVRTGAEAIDRASEGGYDICLVDHRLPDRDGLGVCRDLHELLACPILMVTGSAEELLAARALEAGADDLIVKGTGFAQRLADEVRVHLGGDPAAA